MTSNSNVAAIKIAALWKGYQVRKIFADLNAVSSFQELEEVDMFFCQNIFMNIACLHLVPVWQTALRYTSERLWKEWEMQVAPDEDPLEEDDYRAYYEARHLFVRI